MKKNILVVTFILAFALPIVAKAELIHSNDDSGKMVSIYGGEVGRGVLNKLIARSGNPELSRVDQLLAEFLQQVLINRWQTLAQ